MSPVDAAIEVCRIGLNAAVLWLAWHCLWRKACQERFRQNLFELRDDLFDYARGGKVAFTDPVYVLLRCNINGMIRFSHLISVTRLFTFISLQRYIGARPIDGANFRVKLAEVKGKDVKEELERIYDKMRAYTFKHLLLASPHILVVAPLLALLDKALSKTETPGRPSPMREPAVGLIEAQAHDAFQSEALKRRHEQELASV